MKKIKQSLLLAKEDFEVIISYLKLGLHRNTFSRQEAEGLESELKRAKLVDKNELPDDVVRLNSSVTIKDESEEKVLQVTVVTPEKADIKKLKISIFSPIGTALIGISKGQKIAWKVPSGKKIFSVLDVNNSFG